MSEDGELMDAVASGHVEAFEELYTRYSDRAYRLAWSVCHNAERSEDAVQEAFTSIWRSRSRYAPEYGTVAAWLLTVVRYRAIDVARRNARHASRRTDDEPIQLLSAPGALAEEAVGRSESAHVLALLKNLPDAQQEVIALAFYGELTHTEIAERLGLPPGTVKGRMRLGMDKLRRELQRPPGT